MERQISFRALIGSMEPGAELKLKFNGEKINGEIRICRWPDKFYCSVEFSELEKTDVEFHYGYISGDFWSLDALFSFLSLFNLCGNAFVEFNGSFYTLLG
jgi:hypothetical protein